MLNGHDPYAYLNDVLARLPAQKNEQLDRKKLTTSLTAGTTPRDLVAPRHPWVQRAIAPTHSVQLRFDETVSLLFSAYLARAFSGKSIKPFSLWPTLNFQRHKSLYCI